jgi:putative sporulation protein YtaF
VSEYLSLLVLALAVSLDGFGVGVSYGLRKIKIPLLSILIITSCSALVILLATLFGEWISEFVRPEFSNQIGAWILIAIGCWAIYNFSQNKETKRPETAPSEQHQAPHKVINIEIKILGLVIQILKTPTAADVDRSGTISGSEAAVLGLALSLDAFGAGIGAAFMGYPPKITALLVSVLSTVFIILGLRIGFLYSDTDWVKKISFLPGVILILFGIFKIW